MTRIYKWIFAVVATMLLASMPAMAQHGRNHEDWARWYQEMRQYKLDYMIRELNISDEQKPKFVTIYDNMENEVEAVRRQTRQMVREVEKKGDAATDLEREKAAEASFELQSREGAIEMKYFKELKALLTPEQLLKFKKVEMKFTHELMKHRRPKNK